jgi:hypothetical protein
MKVYEWQETEHHYIAIIRPMDLFDPTSLEKPSADDPEVRLRARHKINKQMEGYAIAYGKKHSLESVKAELEKSPDIYSDRDAKDLEKLKNPELGQKKPSIKRLEI